jgi:hypothetical protein
VRGAAIVACALASALALSACGETSRDRVTRYIEDANRIQRRSAPQFKRANDAYARFSRHQRDATATVRDLTAAERSIRITRARIAKLRPPAEAAVLHRRLLRVFDANAAMASETRRLAGYLPVAERVVAPLGQISARLRRSLAAAADPVRQSRALRLYAASLGALLSHLRRLEPPPILVPTHRGQIARLSAALRLARRLRTALVEQDAERVTTLLLRFRGLNGRRSGERALVSRSIRAYNRRYRAISRIVQDAQRERSRLERALGGG